MLLPPAVADPEASRPYFAALRRLRDDLVAHGQDAATLTQLSMGMSHDFEVAIEEGATLVRVAASARRTPSPPEAPAPPAPPAPPDTKSQSGPTADSDASGRGHETTS